jgi:hypothetical protein
MQSLLAVMGAIVTRHQSPAAKDMQGVGKIVDFRKIGRDQDDPSTVLQQLGKELVDLDLRPDINADGRLVKDIKIGAMV